MRLHSGSRFRNASSLAVLSVGISLLLTVIAPAKGSRRQQESHPQADIGLEIRLLDALKPLTRFARTRGGSTVIPRSLLRINNPEAAGEFTALEVQAETEGDTLRVIVSIVLNDISKQEVGWKDKKEKIAGSYLIRVGESIRTSDLEQFGIEPIEMKAMDATPVVLKPGEGPRITNSAALEVEKLEKHFDHYSVWLKNKSDKNIVAYSVSTGGNTTQSRSGSYGTNALLAAGAVSSELYLSDPQIEVDGIPVFLVVFEDGTFEGDPRLAVQYLAKAEGVRIQSPSVLRRIEQTLKVEDSDLRAEFVKLEAELWLIPEAMDKPTALQFLKTRFPDQDEKTLSALYEVFKGGLYDGRNIALSALGDTLRQVQDMEQRGQLASAVESIRRTLERLKETFGSIISAPR
jgi:hypothetical protein